MKASSEFMNFGRRFHLDFYRDTDTWDDVMRRVLSPFEDDRAARLRLRAFIEEALRDTVSDDDLQALWHSTPADVYFFKTSELRHMLSEARDRL